MRKSNLILSMVLALLLAANVADLIRDGFDWLTGLSIVLAAAAIVLNLVAGRRSHE